MIRFGNLNKAPLTMQGLKDTSGMQMHMQTAARAPGVGSAPPPRLPLDPSDPEPQRQLTGDVASPGAATMPNTRVVTADTPAGLAERQLGMNNGNAAAVRNDIANANSFASAVAPAQQMQQLGDQSRMAATQQPNVDLTSAIAEQAERARGFAGDYTWNLMPRQGQQTVDNAILTLAGYH